MHDPLSADTAPSPGHSRTVPLLCLAGAVLLWGTSFAATKTALSGFSPMAVVWLRMVIASVVFAPFWRRLPRPDYRPGDWKVLALTGLLVPCLYFLLEPYAIQYTTSSQAGMIAAIVPLLVAVGAWLWLHERLGVRQIAAIGVSLVGVVVLSLGDAGNASAPNPVLGNVLELLAMVCSAGWMLIVRHLGERYNPWFITGAQAGVGALFFLPGALTSGPASWAAATPAAWASVVYLGIFVTIGGFGLYNVALSVVPASRASLAVNLNPAVALLTGWVALGERLTPLQLVACVAIVGAVVFGENGRAKEVVPAPTIPVDAAGE